MEMSLGFKLVTLMIFYKLGGDPHDMECLQVAAHMCSGCDIHDVRFSGYMFTWSNKRRAPSMVEKRLDFA